MASAKVLMDVSMSLIDQAIALSKGQDEDPLTDSFLGNVKGFVERSKAYVDQTDEELHAKLGDSEEQLRQMNKLIELLEENKAEL